MTDDVNSEPGEQGSGFRFRDTTRAPFTTDVRLRFDRLGGAVSAETADISMEGMFVKTAEPRPVGTLVQFEFDLEDGETVQGLGDVVWVRARGSENKPAGMGIQFRYVDPKSREHVFKIVSKFISQISGSEAMPSIPTDGPPEENPIPTGTVAVPLSSLPGLGPEDAGTGGEDGASAPASLAMTPPPPPPAGDDGPFGGLLRGESVEPSEPARSTGGGSFSLSVPRHDRAPQEAEEGLPPLSDSREFLTPIEDSESNGESSDHEEERSEPQEPSRSSLAATVDYGSAAAASELALEVPSASSGVLAGGVASDPTLAPPSTLDRSLQTSDQPSAASRDDKGSSLFERSAAGPPPVEPYVPPRETPDVYGGGSAQAAGGGSRARLLVLLLVVAMAAALYVYRPWERFLGESAATNEEAIATGSETPQAGDDPGSAGSAADAAEPTEFETPSGPRVGFVAEESPGETTESADSAPASPEELSEETTASPAREWPRDGRLGGVEAISGAGQTLVRITADRPLGPGDYEAVALASPPRYLVKIRGLNALYSGGIEGLMFRGLRSGVHPVGGGSELHLVFDMTSAGFEADAELVNGEILVTFR